MNGWTGQYLHIDCTARTATPCELPESLRHEYIGGKGIAGQFMIGTEQLAWDDPAMPVVLFTGPLTGTIAPTPGRATFMSRSPLTGLYSDSSVGGKLGVELKRAGWDGLVITGQSETLWGLEIENDVARFVDATTYQGATADELFEREQGTGSLACVGPAAETGCRFASIQVDSHHAAGRTGLGLTLARKGFKFLKVHGTGRVNVHDKAALKLAREQIIRLTNASPILMGSQGFSCFGTGSLFDLMDSRRMMPTDNFQKTCFGNAEKLNAYAYKERYHPEKHGCSGCHIRCKKVAKDGTTMPEFETMSHFTALIGNTDMELVVEANRLCNSLGMDSITAGATLACWREITGTDFTPGRLLAMLRDMGRGRGEGKELAQGSRRYAESKSRPECSMSVKGLELPAYDPRGAYGMALAYTTSTRGGCHLRAYPVSHEILRKPVATDRFSFSGKARIIKIAEDANAVVDSLTACKFTFLAASLDEYARAYTAVTGVKTTAQALLKIGEKIICNERKLNASQGFDANDDDLPQRFFTETGSSGHGVTINPIDRDAFLKARAAYYSIRKLNEKGICSTENNEEREES